MPELPEVEFAARHLKRWLVGHRIAKVEVEPTRIIRPAKPAEVVRALSGRMLEHVDRRAKYLLLRFDHGQGAMSHLGMTGKWVRRPEGERVRFSRLRLFLRQLLLLQLFLPRLFLRHAHEVLPGDQHERRKRNGKDGVLVVGHRDPVLPLRPAWARRNAPSKSCVIRSKGTLSAARRPIST